MTANAPEPKQTMAALGDVDPYPFYDKQRSVAPLVWDESMKGWLVTSYQICRHVETREDLFRHPYADASPALVEIKGGRRNVTILQGPEHKKVHVFLQNLFAPRVMEQYRQHHVRPIVSYTIDRFVRRGRADLASEYADQIPPRVLMSLFGMPWQDDAVVARVLKLHDDVLIWIGGQNKDPEATRIARAASDEINAILLPYIRMRKANPGNDLMSQIWSEGPRVLENMTEDDALATCRELFLGGTDTTVHSIANALYMLLTEPDAMTAVRRDRDKALANFVEEALRMYGSVHYRFRIANEACELGGMPVKKNETLILINAAANRDPEKYTCPAQIDLARATPRDHLAFNVGPRSCIGAALARAEIRDAIGILLDRVSGLRLDSAAEPPRFRFHYIRSFRPLHVRFDA